MVSKCGKMELSEEQYLSSAGVERLYSKFGRKDLEENEIFGDKCNLCNPGSSVYMSGGCIRLLEHWDTLGHQTRLEQTCTARQFKQFCISRAEIQKGLIKFQAEKEVTSKLRRDASALLEQHAALLRAPSWRCHLESLVFKQVLMGAPRSALLAAVAKYARRERAAVLELALIKFAALRRSPFASVSAGRSCASSGPAATPRLSSPSTCAACASPRCTASSWRWRRGSDLT